MAIHELTTNAMKYGALSVPEGRVDVVWRREAEDMLVLEWVETGGPPVVAPTHRGFGMGLIERGLRQDMSAEVSVEFLASGVRAQLSAPLGGGATHANEAARTG
jgi:two-component sensor histidine kinase